MKAEYIIKQIKKLENNNKAMAKMNIGNRAMQLNLDINNKLIASYKKELTK